MRSAQEMCALGDWCVHMPFALIWPS